MSLAIDRRTGLTFKRTGGNYPAGSKARDKMRMKQHKLNTLYMCSDTGPILTLSVALSAYNLSL